MANIPARLNVIGPEMVTAHLELPGRKIVANHGIVRGLTVRSRSVVGSFFGGLQTIFGGNISIYANLCEQAREEAYLKMVEHAALHGANAIVCVRYDATEVMPGVTEVLAYGSAVTVQ